MTLTIRAERAGDAAAITEVVGEAFAGHPHSRQTEPFVVAALRREGALTISLVAESDGEMIGHIAFSPVSISGKISHFHALGPLAVSPPRQRQGAGQALVRAGLEALRNAGSRGCVVVGDPAYYRRFGFIHHPDCTVPGIPPEYVLALSFDGAPVIGDIAHHPAFRAEQ